MRPLSFGLCAAIAASAVACTGIAAAAKPKQDPAKIVCRNVSESGSRLKTKRVCHTNAQWAEIRRQAKEEIDKIQNTRPASGN